MIASFDIRAALVGAALLAWPQLAHGQAEVPSVPMPEVPEAPELPEPEIPDIPQGPELPELGKKTESRVPPGYTGPTKLVLHHKKRFVAYPRFGFSQVVGTSEEEGISQATAGLDLQLALNQRIYIAAEVQSLYILTGEYGLIFEEPLGNLQTYGAGEFTFLTGIGAGIWTSLLDEQELWTHIAIKVGYLHPFYGAVWLAPDIEKEFLRSDDRYWVASLSPQVGALVPVRVDRSEIVPGLRVFAGAQASVALIFGGAR